MKRAAIAMMLVSGIASAEPVTGVGVETAWLAPRTALEVDPARGVERPVSLDDKHVLPARGFLLAHLLPGETAWIRFDEDDAAAGVRFAFVTLTAGASASVDVEPTRVDARDFVVTAPAGPPRWLGLATSDGKRRIHAQLWVAAAQSPGYRWELWEEAAKDWADHPDAPPPAPPTGSGEALTEALGVVADAAALARAEGGTAPVATLLRAEALLADLPYREPSFPYFRRVELTGAVAGARPRRTAAARRAFDVEPGPLRFTVDGPGILRVDAYRVFAPEAARQRARLGLALFAGARLVASADDEVTPFHRGSESLSSLRRLVIAAPPGRHQYTLDVRGGTTRLALYLHRRSMHAEDLVSRGEDLALLLSQARAATHTGLLGELVTGEAAWLALDDAAARAAFENVAAAARAPRLRAFALARLAALDGADATADRHATAAIAVLDAAPHPAAAPLRALITAERIARHLAVDDREGAARLAREPALAPSTRSAPLLREAPGPRSRALPLLEAAVRAHPLDGELRHRLAQEWWLGSRWSALPSSEHDGAQPVDLTGPSDELRTCAQAAAHGARAYVPLPPGRATELSVRGAPGPYLHRFHLVALRRDGPHLGFLDVAIDGANARVPLVMPVERIPLAAAVGAHTLTSSTAEGVVLAPCALMGDGEGVVVEHRYARLAGVGERARMSLFEPGVDAYVGLEVRAAPELRGGRLRVLTDRGVIGSVEVNGGGVDGKLLGAEHVGPPLLLVLRLPATARELEIVRDDAGAPLLVRTMLRRGLAAAPPVAPRPPPAADPDPAQLARLRELTRGVRAATAGVARAQARLARAELLVGLDALTAARSDLELALPDLDAAGAEHARALLRSLAEPPLVPAGDARARVLAAGAGVDAGDRACLDVALRKLAVAPASARAQAAACAGPLAAVVAGRLADDAGALAEAARWLAAAWSESHRPALAREAALRVAERGAGPGAAEAYALAAVAAADGDSDGARVLRRLSGTSRWRSISAVDAGPLVRLDDEAPSPPSLRAALLDVPWPVGEYEELRRSRANELVFDVDRSLGVTLMAACDVGGRVDDAEAACRFRVEVDGAPVDATPVPSGVRDRVAHVSLVAGAHRVKVALDRERDDTIAFLHVATNRRVGSATVTAEDGGLFPMVARAPRPHRFVATTVAPVRLRVQGPTALRIDVLSMGGSAPAIEVAERSPAGPARHEYPICRQPADKLPLPRGGYDCHSTVVAPFPAGGTHEVTIRPTGARPVALALAVREDEVAPVLTPEVAVPVLPDRRLPAPPPEAALLALPPPMATAWRDFGALQIQELGVVGGPGAVDPRIGDRFAETALLYRRKVDHLPLWLLGGAFLRLRPSAERVWGPPSAGGQLLWFTRIPPIKLRWLGDAHVFTQNVAGHQEYSLALETYLERSFEVAPRFYLLPRAAFVGKYQSLRAPPLAPRNDPLAAVPIDPQVWNGFDARHNAGVYGQLLLWWVPFINMIVYAEGRVATLHLDAIDRASGRAGFDVAFHTTELVGYYDVTDYLTDPSRRHAYVQHLFAGEIDETVWVHRNHRLVVRVGGFVDPVALSATAFFGAFWEMSFGRGLDDYSTPEINLPQQLGRGRGLVGAEHRL